MNPDDHQDDQQSWTESERADSHALDVADLAATFISVVEGRRDDEH